MRVLGARDGPVTEGGGYDATRESPSGARNRAALADQTAALAAAVGQTLDAGDVPLVVGGDCSMLLGSSLALRRRGRFGLVFVDRLGPYVADTDVVDLAELRRRSPERAGIAAIARLRDAGCEAA